jgi:pimeloyl-ACP methyl ester carboxylesterase
MTKLSSTPTLLAVLIPGIFFLANCAQKPGIEVLAKPVATVAEIESLFDSGKFSASTRDVLRRDGLTRLATTDPSAAIRALAEKLRIHEETHLRLAAVEIASSAAIPEYDSASRAAFAYLLTAIELSGQGLDAPESGTRAALEEIFDMSSADLASLLHRQNLPENRTLEIAAPLRTYHLGWKSGAKGILSSGFYDTLEPTSRMRVMGYAERNSRPGVGGSMVGFRAGTPARRAKDPFMPHTGYAVPLTSTVDLSESSAHVVLHDVLDQETVTVAGKLQPLAGDFTAAVATAAAATPGSSDGFLGMLRPNQASLDEGLYLLEPWRPDRIPLVLVHGLMSTPRTWETVINACYGDPVIRENYQILVFFYPTGFPIPENAAVLRERLKALQLLHDPDRNNPKMREMVMIGHSMGCNLTNYQIRDGGDSLWFQLFNKSIDQLDAPLGFKEQARERAYFKANTDISRVVFICGPHRGSPWANSWIGRLGIDLMRLPFATLDRLSGNLLGDSTPLGRTLLNESPSSIGNLSVDSPILLAILNQPMPREPKLHSIIGDRGRAPGNGSSDGVVPYWSSHLHGVPETFIAASHTTATRNPENAIEVRRILHQHVGRKFP